METLTLEQAYYIGELIAAIAVVVSLIYVALQVRQNTYAVRLNTNHQVAEELTNLYDRWNNDGVMSDIFFRGLAAPEDLAGIEKFRFYTMMHNYFRTYENAYYQQIQGAFDPLQWTGVNQMLCDTAKLPGLNTYWQDRKYWYSVDFQKHFDKLALGTSANPAYRQAGT